ncbi:hypothetical protein GGR21_003491 [Dysgonomonas hofstadii]|uniref:DUF2975 domain-containing protein n=1 Tax=Dysgonomonas hofstadii TaxID=637886 RepID=A0A840CR94_9BACT|nr:hypothetical protein [Dysgonomonas hofstadii]MBB4037571.1 hypothetical protein [Dysgonomonas hofstadii]
MVNYLGTKIGACFTAGSLLLTLTLVVPVFSILPGSLLEAVAQGLVNNDPYSNVGKLTILFLIIMFATTLIIVLVRVRKTGIRIGRVWGKKIIYMSKIKIVLIMLLFYFIVHPLVFYLYWGIQLDFRSDGQLIMEAIRTFPISSLSFIFIGIMIDIVKNRGIENG